MVLKTLKIPLVNPCAYSWATVWGASWNLSRVTILYKRELQIPLFQQTISLFSEHSTLALALLIFFLFFLDKNQNAAPHHTTPHHTTPHH
jgi:hypothetical protein